MSQARLPKGTLKSVAEMATLRQRALEAQRTKAQRGELWMHLPVGLVYGPTGAIELDPDARVQQAIRLVLQKFHELGSTRKCWLWLRRESISVPVMRQITGERHTDWSLPKLAHQESADHRLAWVK